MRTPAKNGTKPEDDTNDIEVGSYFLETLTTGMYENPFHCIREYVQNGFDAIQDAAKAGLIEHKDGRISVTVEGSARSPSLVVKDNGTGISKDRSYKTLVSLGASRKTPAQHAGFRGIGRLAGIAYCTTLRFTTTVVGEDVATVVEFDCGLIRGYFVPGSEALDLRALVRLAVKSSTIPATVGDHYTQVEMAGLVNEGAEFVEMTKLQPYLQQVCPVDYVDSFEFADRIRGIGASFGEPLRVVHVEAQQRREKVLIYKAYKNSAPISKKNTFSKLTDIEALSSKEHGWFGWIGVSNFPGEIVDEAVAGVRFRLKNIQIGDVRLIEDIAEGLTAGRSERRLQRWAVGEVFVTNTQVVPNARRDGFEDNEAWRAIRNDIRKQVADRVRKLLRAASDSRSLVKDLNYGASRVSDRVAVTSILDADRQQLEGEIKRHIQMLGTKSKFTGVDPKDVANLLAQFRGFAATVAKLPRQEPPAPLPEEKKDEPPEEDPDQAMPAGSGEEVGAEPRTLLEVVYKVLRDELGESEAERLIEIIVAAAETIEE